MFAIKANTLVPVRHPTISISTWFVLFLFNFFTNLREKKDRIPPKTKVIPKKKAAT